MVGLFAGLKWRLVTSRIRAAGGGTKAVMIIGWSLALLVIALIVIGCFALRTDPALARTLVASLFTIQMVSWVLAPLVAFGVDETVDPAKFALLPLTTGTLQRGLLVTSLVGYLPVANALLLIGAAIALSSSWGLLPIALLCAATQLLLCVVVSRAASTAMSGLMSGRRGRDLGMVVGSLLFLGYIGLSFALNQTSSSITPDGGVGARRRRHHGRSGARLGSQWRAGRHPVGGRRRAVGPAAHRRADRGRRPGSRLAVVDGCTALQPHHPAVDDRGLGARRWGGNGNRRRIVADRDDLVGDRP